MVDGVWGPRSQKAWNEYLRNRSVVERRSPADKLDLTDPKAAPGAATDRREQARLARQQAQMQARREAERKLKEQRQLVLDRAARLKRNPSLGANMSLRDLADVLVDEEVGYNPARNPALTKALQEHLKKKGYKVAVNGQMDAATAKALKKAFEREAFEERQRQIRFIEDRLFKSGLVKPGDTPEWFSFGKIPEPGDLLETLQRGGFDADLMFKQLLLHALDPGVAWNSARNQQLFEIAQTVAPLGASAIAQIAGDANAVPAWQYVADILSVTDLVPFGDYSALTEEERKRALQWRAKSDETRLKNAAAVGQARAMAKALLLSEGPEEFQRKMAAVARAQDKRLKEFQQKLARKSSFWGDAIDAILLPGELTRQAITASVVNSVNSFQAWKDGRLLRDDELVRQEGAEKILAEMNPVLRFGFELTVDPLNLVAPTRLVSSAGFVVATRFGKGASLGRYVLTGEGLARSIVYQKGTWDKAALGRLLAGSDDVLRIQDTRLGEKIAEYQSRLAVTKDEAMAAINKRLAHAAVLGWKQPTFTVAGTKITLPKLGDRNLQALLDETDRQLVQAVAKAPFLQPLIHELKQKNASLFLRHTREGQKSQYGAALRGHLAETFRPIIAARLAVETANGVYKKTLFERFGPGWESLADEAGRKQAGQAAIARYMEVLEGFGSFVAAGPSPALREAEQFAFDSASKTLKTQIRDLPALLDKRVNLLLEETEKAIFPAIQDELERHAQTLLDAAKAEQAKLTKTVAAAAKPVTHGGEQDFFRYAEHGEPGFTFVGVKAGKAAVFRAQDGTVKGHALVGDNGSVRVFVDPAYRRQGIATKLYETLSKHGVPIEDLSGRGEITKEGAAFFAGRRAKAAGLAHPIWDERGLWRGRHAAQEGDLVATIRKSFAPDEVGRIRNPQFDIPHTPQQMARAYQSEVRRRVGRLEDYAARRIEGETIPDDPAIRAAAADSFEREKQKIIDSVKSAWVQGGDGMFRDTRKVVEASNLYLRHLGRFSKRRIDFSGDDDLDFLAVLGDAPGAGDKLTKLEEGLFKFAASLAQYGQVPLAGTKGFLTPGVRGDRNYVEFLREAVDKRMFALNQAESSALSSEFRAQAALWLAWQNANSLPMKIAYRALASQLHLWKFSTLALRPAWAVRNFVDNTVKAIIRGVRDPRYFLVGPGQKLGSVLSQDIAVLRQLIRFCDDLFGTNVGHHFDTILSKVWELPSGTLAKVFSMHNIEVPPEVFEQGLKRDIFDRSTGLRLTRTADDERLVDLGLKDAPSLAQKAGVQLVLKGRALENFFWNILGEAPENYARAVVYRKAYSDAIKDIVGRGSEMSSVDIHLTATNRAIKAVDDTLFDYSKITVVEDNIKVFFPFIQYWRKNSVFWVESFGDKPWLTNAVLQFDDDRRDAHGDLPAWMRRYFHTDEIADALAVVPGLDGMFEALGLGDGAQFDPINMLSLAPFYRAFKQGVYGENVNLPSDRPGVKIIAPMLDALNEWGLGVNPLFRKPLEAAGIANYRAWQRVFPQTSLVEAIANASGAEGVARLAAAMDRIGALGFPVTDSNSIAENFDYWVQTVVAEQVAAGEEPNIPLAEETVRDWFLVQNLWGYFGGIYWRRATPEDMYLSKLTDDVLNGHLDYDKLSAQDKKLLRLWGMRGMNRLTYDRYIDLLPVIEAYYRADLEGKDEIVKQNPEIIRWVDGDFTGHPVSQKFIRYAHRYVDQELFFDATEIADTLDVAHDTRKVAEDLFISPELREFWRLNDTPTRIRERMVQAEIREYFNELNRAYFAIPESDFEARDAFVDDHPELVRSWNRNNDPADDYEAISGHIKADLRDSYFRIVKERGFEGAAEFLKQYPFMFEGTASEKKIKDGQWLPGRGKWSAERLADFREAKPHLTWFFDTFMPKVGQKRAWAWLDSSDSDAAKSILGYLKKYPTARRLAYMRAAPFLRIYFGLPPEKRAEWLRGDSEGAAIVRSYFEKYANEKGMTQHAKDYLDTKSDLNYYFSLSKERRAEWLKSDDPRAVKVLAYFKKYGKEHQYERGFKKLVDEYPELRHGTPEQVRRMEFWRRYYSLTPDARPAFVTAEAEKHGIFIYGEFGEKEMHDREQEYMRRAVGLGLSKRQSAYLYVKPLLDFYRTLDKDEKGLFIRANPELQWYFDNFSTKSVTGDRKLDGLVEQYFKLPADSFARAKFLREHPQVQDWFDKRSSPAEAAMRSLLEQYFSLRGWERKDFLLSHPEVAAYFEQRRAERQTEQDALRAFDFADPRLAPFFRDAADLERAAQRMRERLRRASLDAVTPDGIGVRRERRAA